MVSFKIIDVQSIEKECNFIYNAFYLTHPNNEQVFIHIECDKGTFIVPVRFEKKAAYLGLWLSELPDGVLLQLCRYVFRNWPELDHIYYQNCLQYLSGRNNCTNVERNHWSIILPLTPEDLNQRLSSKKRYNIKREKRLASEQLGTYEIREYTSDSVPEDIVYTYFEFKKKQFGTDYRTTPSGYLKQYHVSHIYTLHLSNAIGAIVMSCEQGTNVYLENLAYNPTYSKYSLGSILYDEFLKRIILKGKTGIYLGYGQHQYKSMYGAIEQTVYTGTVYRSRVMFIKEVMIPEIYRKIRSLGGRILRKLRIMHRINNSKNAENKENNT